MLLINILYKIYGYNLFILDGSIHHNILHIYNFITTHLIVLFTFFKILVKLIFIQVLDFLVIILNLLIAFHLYQ
jgi:hypothetical protein